jgi:hypothetical protein
MRNVTDKNFRENQNTFCVQFFFEHRDFYEKMWKNVKPDKPQMTTQRVRFANWIYKATETQTEYKHFFSTATVVKRTRLNITSQVHCVSCLLL